MIYLENTAVNPYFNLACEEYCLKSLSFPEDIVMLWRDDNAIIVGSYQNTAEEINAEYTARNKIKVARRITGGGAVYHDLGNLNYTFILGVKELENLDMKLFALPVVKALAKMGVTAELSGRNDITIDGKKISGTAQHIDNNRLLYHGTLLFDSDLSILSECLKVNIDKIESKGIKSVRSRVTNIKDHLQENYDVLEFKKLLIYYLFEGNEFKEYRLTEEDLENIRRLEKEKYSDQAWVYGESPDCNVKNTKRFPGGSIQIHLNIKENKIEKCRIYGDFLGVIGIEEIENLMQGVHYTYDDIRAKLAPVNITAYFGSITMDELISCFL
jgi:lipoyltransferase and lipoate-protein ligase